VAIWPPSGEPHHNDRSRSPLTPTPGQQRCTVSILPQQYTRARIALLCVLPLQVFTSSAPLARYSTGPRLSHSFSLRVFHPHAFRATRSERTQDPNHYRYQLPNISLCWRQHHWSLLPLAFQYIGAVCQRDLLGLPLRFATLVARIHGSPLPFDIRG
jgi:hypothetical protein